MTDHIEEDKQNKQNPDYPKDPDFSFAHDGDMIKRAYEVIYKTESWHLLSNFKGESFMFSKDDKINTLIEKVADDYQRHSGASIGWTMRQLEYIAKHGFTKYKNYTGTTITPK